MGSCGQCGDSPRIVQRILESYCFPHLTRLRVWSPACFFIFQIQISLGPRFFGPRLSLARKQVPTVVGSFIA
jgi:hypothetical protein